MTIFCRLNRALIPKRRQSISRPNVPETTWKWRKLGREWVVCLCRSTTEKHVPFSLKYFLKVKVRWLWGMRRTCMRPRTTSLTMKCNASCSCIYNIRGFFCNFFLPKFWQILSEIIFFNKTKNWQYCHQRFSTRKPKQN